MSNAQATTPVATGTDKSTPARVLLARRAIQIARVLLLEEAQAASNMAIYGAVMRATWALDTQALLLTPKTATAGLFNAGNDRTPTATEEPRYRPFKGIIEQIQADTTPA